jgi:hypothetical protein
VGAVGRESRGSLAREDIAMNPLIVLVAVVGFSATSDPQKICLGARNAAAASDQANAYQSCIRDETQARDELKQKWSQFSANARATCAEPPGLNTSYVEMLTCLEMESGSNFGMTKPTPAAPDAAAPKP